MKKLSLALRLLAAAILLQTLYFKFTGAPESVFIFSTLGVEPWGRCFAGLSELVACALLLIPATSLLGAAMGVGIMLGAILSHVFVLGLEVQGDHYLLFSLALIVLSSCLALLYIGRDEIRNRVSWLIVQLKARRTSQRT